MAEMIGRGAVDEALEVLDAHIGRTRSTYAAGIEDFVLADRAAAMSISAI